MDNSHFSRLLSVDQAYALDKAAVQADGLANGELMQRAGQAAFRLARLLWPRARRVVVICGPGNNGGDGYVFADQFRAIGKEVLVCSLGDPANLAGDALAAKQRYQNNGGELVEYAGGDLPPADLVVDAMLGIGSARELSGMFVEAARSMNAHAAPVLALDVPTGIDANTGSVLGLAVEATATVCFIGLKKGLVTGAASNYVGNLYLADLEISNTASNQLVTDSFLLNEGGCRLLCRPRDTDTHKGRQGQLLVLGGDSGMTGAATLAGEAGLRGGAGLVRLAMLEKPYQAIAELMIQVVTAPDQIDPVLMKSDVLLAGPGLGQTPAAQRMLNRLLEYRRPNQALVLDADALNMLAIEPVEIRDSIMTPHPGEAARLLEISVADVQADRYGAAITIANRFESICVLKGAGTVISDGKTSYVCDRGHPAMASAGTGDVLAGLIAGLTGQGFLPLEAAVAAVYVHARAGEAVASKAGYGLIASDMLPAIAGLLGELCGQQCCRN